jgi:hypothetical protein
MSCVLKNVSTIRRRADKVPFMTCCNRPYDLLFFWEVTGALTEPGQSSFPTKVQFATL